jgi:hypothetical protein
MAQFLLLFVGLGAPERADDVQTEAYTAEWAQWMAGIAGHGMLVTGGPLLASGKHVDRDATTDLVLEHVDVGGFVVIDAPSVDEAAAMAATAPHTALGGSTIVRPVMARA